MAANQITLPCHYCGDNFLRNVGEHNRAVKRGSREFCSPMCRTIWRNKRCSKGNQENLRPGRDSDEFSSFRYYLRRILTGSGKRYGESDLTLEYLSNLWQQQNGKCVYTGLNMDLPRTTGDNLDKPHSASLDRRDSGRGYLQGNVQFVCQFINLGKNRFTPLAVQDFLRKLRA